MADNVKSSIDTWKKRLDELLHDKDNCFTPIFEKFEAKTGVRRLNLVLGLVLFVSLYLMVGYGADFLCNFIGFIYPAYASVKAIESREKDDDTKWLTYWVVFSVFSLVEFFADIFLFWIPLYWFLKCVFLIYCMVPFSWNGSVFIYHRFIRPFVLKHEKKIDSAIDVAADLARTAVGEVQEHAGTLREQVGNVALDHAFTKQD